MRRDFRESGRDGAPGEVEPPLRGGGLPLPGLKRWRLRRRLSQRDLALRAELTQDHLWKIESGRRGCNPSVAQHLADLLKVDLLDLRRHYDEDAEEEQAFLRPARPKVAYRQVHQAYLKIFLVGTVGSAYAAMDEWAIEKHCQERSFEEVLEAVRSRKREIEFLRGVLEDGGVLEDPNLPKEVRSFGAAAGQFLLSSCGHFSSLSTRVSGRSIGGEVFSLFPVVGSLPRRFAHKVAASRAEKGEQAPREGSLHAPLAGIHRRFIVRC